MHVQQNIKETFTKTCPKEISEIFATGLQEYSHLKYLVICSKEMALDFCIVSFDHLIIFITRLSAGMRVWKDRTVVLLTDVLGDPHLCTNLIHLEL